MQTVIHHSLLLFFIWLMMTAALHKFRHGSYYAALLRDYLTLPNRAYRPTIYFIAVSESLTALLLLIPSMRVSALIAIALLLTLYLFGMSWQLLQGRGDLDCGCSGPAAGIHLSPALLIRNLILIALTGFASSTVDPISVTGFEITAVVSALFLILLYLCAEQLLANAQRFRASWGQ